MSLILRGQRGFTTVTLMGVLAIGSLLVAGGFAAVDPDITFSRKDQDHKQAYGAGEAGLQWYLNSLGQDNDYYVRCTWENPDLPWPSPTEQPPVNPRWDGEGSDPRVWRTLPGEKAEYAVELLPAPGYDECVVGDQYSMVDPNGNMRVRVTGRSRGEVRSVIATLRRRNFIDFIYFTHFETLDPAAYSSSSARTWAATNCAQFRKQRKQASDGSSSFDCTEIQFAPTDFVRGPLHTNDSIWVCGGATFGRDGHDSIELNGQSPGYVELGSCEADPQIDGSLVYPAGQLELPPSNLELEGLADEDYFFEGRTEIVLDGSSMTVTERDGTVETKPLPPNGVIYVKNDGVCGSGYLRAQTYSPTASTTCGDVWVQGTYSSDLTIAADNDVVIDEDLTRSADGLLLGLIANNFVRVYHPVTDPASGSCANAEGALPDPVIDAAILALNHSFIVDNWYCGAQLGDLEVNGAIAQRYRGPVGTSGGTGYVKDYNYNDRLRYREPPYFLDPVQASWRVARQNEQIPAVGAGD